MFWNEGYLIMTIIWLYNNIVTALYTKMHLKLKTQEIKSIKSVSGKKPKGRFSRGKIKFTLVIIFNLILVLSSVSE